LLKGFFCAVQITEFEPGSEADEQTADRFEVRELPEMVGAGGGLDRHGLAQFATGEMSEDRRSDLFDKSDPIAAVV